MIRNFVFILIVVLAFRQEAHGQDFLIDQPQYAPLLLAPSMAGDAGTSRLNLLYRRQWPLYQNGFRETYVAYDQLLNKIPLGVGGYYQFTNDTDQRKLNHVNASCSYHFITGSGDLRITPGFEFGYTYGTMKFLVGSDTTLNDEIQYADFGFSAFLHSAHYYIGAVLQHVNSPKVGFTGGNDFTLHPKFAITAGASITLDDYGQESMIGPMVHYTIQGNTEELNLGLITRYSFFAGSLYYRNRDAFIFGAGLHFNRLLLNYSYGLDVKNPKKSSGNSHEMSLMFFLKARDEDRVFPGAMH